MREETEGAGGGKGRGSLSSALPFLSRWNTQMSPSSRPAPPPQHYHTVGWRPQGAWAISTLCYHSCGQEVKKRGKDGRCPEGHGPSGHREGPRGRAKLEK